MVQQSSAPNTRHPKASPINTSHFTNRKEERQKTVLLISGCMEWLSLHPRPQGLPPLPHLHYRIRKIQIQSGTTGIPRKRRSLHPDHKRNLQPQNRGDKKANPPGSEEYLAVPSNITDINTNETMHRRHTHLGRNI